MPRKIEIAATTAARMRSPLRARGSVAFQKTGSSAGSGDENQDAMDIEEGDGGDDDQMMEMITMLKEFQKRKTSASTSRNAVFQRKKSTLYTDARKAAESVVTEGVAYIEQFRTRLIEAKANEISKDQHVKQLADMSSSLGEIARETLSLYPALFGDLSRRRVYEINETSAMLESHAVERQYSRRRMIKHAKARMDDGLEQQKLAMDATALIKHYKVLLRS